MGGLTYGIIGSNTLTNFVGDVHTTLKKIAANCTDLNTGAHCRWCKAKDTCPAQLEEAEKLLEVDPSDPNIDAGDLGFLVLKAGEIEEWAKSVKQRAHSQLENGGEVDGYKLVAKRGTRQWRDEAEAKDHLRSHRMKVREITESKLISPAKAEKLIKSKGSRCDIGDLIVSKSSGTAMAPLDDKRPAISSRDGSDLNLPS